MTNEIAQTKGSYLTDLQKLDGATLRSFVDPKHQASPQELQTLLAIVKNRNLNPFTREVYFIKYGNNPAQIGFGTIRNNTALKLIRSYCSHSGCFGTIRNNTALKRWFTYTKSNKSFGTIRNNTALKQDFVTL